MQRQLIKGFLAGMLVIAGVVTINAQNKSYVRTWDLAAPETNPANVAGKPVAESKQATRYFDGLGRPLQTVAKEISPLQKDLVSFNVYDEYSREKFSYLPFVSTQTTGGSEPTADGLFKSNALQQQAAFYSDNNSLNPLKDQGESSWLFSQTNFESSPLNRVTSSYAPGSSWVGSSRGVSISYDLNEANEVRLWTVSGTGLVLPSTSSSYNANEIYRGVTTDENGKRVVLYKDKAGQLLLKKVEIKHDGAATITSNTGWLCTYYIYDDLKNLRFVIQPKGVALLEAANWSFGTTDFNSSDIAKELCYYYEYDQKNRLIRKKIPGAGEIYMVYDIRDRLVMAQDANLRQAGKWSVTLYDENNRPVQTGLLLNSYWGSKTFDQHQADATISQAYPFSYSSPPSSTYWEQLTETHYDDYNNVPSGLSGALNTTYINGTNFITTYNSSPSYALQITQSLAVRGLPTWTRTKVLGTTNTFISVVTIYDEKGRVIQLQQINNTGGLDIVTTQYDFSGKVLRAHQKVQKATGASHEFQMLTKLEYDHAGRVTKTKKTLTIGTTAYAERTISRFDYDELGQVKNKKIGTKPNTSDDPLETLTYNYNVRGWLLGVNKNYIKESNEQGYTERWFGFELNYDKDGYGPTTNKQYTGNIGNTIWKSTGDDKQRKYDYTYDASNRLMKADFTQKNSSAWDVNEGINFSMHLGDGTNDPSLAYDENGNIKKMTQYGWKASGSSVIDNLEYRYINNGNRLQVVLDQSNDPSTKLGDFRTSTLHPQAGSKTIGNINTITDYTYDPNGNLLRDYNKDIGNASNDGIVYNHLNLIQSVTVRTTGGAVKGTITYTYDAAGIKLSKVVTETGQPTKTTLYLGGAVYENDVLQFISHEEGRIRYNPANTGNPYPCDYFIKDHLGNNRMVLTEEDKPDQYNQLTFEDLELTEQNAQWENANGQSINVTGVRTAGVSGFNSSTGNGSYVRMIKKSTGAIGAGKLLKVMAGDRIHTYVEYFYNGTNASNSGADPVGSFVNSLLGVFGNNQQVGGILKNDVSAINGSLQANNGFTSFINPSPNTDGNGNEAPKAYLNILFFDEQFKFDQAGSAVIKINYSPGSKQNIDKRVSQAITANKSGYVYVYFSNESETSVYFDNFMLTHEHSSLIEEAHFYPFGGRLEGLCSKAYNKLENKFQFGGKERQAKEFSDGSGIEMYDFGARMYDNQIGRWMSIDPLTEQMRRHSPYNYAYNNPIRFIDPDGMAPFASYEETRDKMRNYGNDRAELEAMIDYAMEHGQWSRGGAKEKVTDKKTIKTVTDAGHGIGERGNVPSHGIGDEASSALNIETQTAAALDAFVFDGENTRTRTEEAATSTKNQIQTRVDIFKGSGANILVSHHLNCETCTNDILIMYHPVQTHSGKDGASSEYESNSLALGNFIKLSLEGTGLFTDRNIKFVPATIPNTNNYNSLGLLRMIDGPNNAAVLLELGNTSQSNMTFLSNNNQQIGTAIALGMRMYAKSQQTDNQY